jgi:DNA-binding PadR family transcriptional regulator
MAPTWTFDRRRVYDALVELEADGLAWSEAVRNKDSPAGWRRIYHATSLGRQMCEVWMQEGGLVSPMRGDIHAWMTLSRPEEAEQILAKLDEYEKDCMEMAEDSREPGGRSVSWRARMLKQHQAAIREQYLCQLRCIKRSRQEIEEYLAEQR